MSAPQTLIQAAIQRLGARLGSGLMDAAAGLSVLAQDAPERLREEFQLFWEEVEAEAARIERGETHGAEGGETGFTTPDPVVAGDPQRQIDDLRARIAALAQRLDRQ
ncbi:MAG: hypothetical protein VKN17_05215 [Cyanobacteriota bacterium]|jgi:hypothetical protein|nr:hypothetical protein [Cyanobacteriota bacterium]